MDDLAVFAEISNRKLARKVGIENIDDLVVVQNVNDFGSMNKGVNFKDHTMKVLNLEIESKKLDKLSNQRLLQDLLVN